MDDGFHDGQTQARAPVGAAAARLGPPEAFEDAGQVLRGDAGSVVDDGQQDVVTPVDDLHEDGGPGGGVLDGVADEVAQHLLQAVGVAHDGSGRRGCHGDAALRIDDLGVLDDAGGQDGEVDVVLLDGPAGVQAGQQGEVFDEQAHPSDFVLDVREGFFEVGT
ncbi:hypothetical protein V1L54_10255 [Streptomyces sp. TRM 70361]|nr:hypothetical protein [Streptomyces sp. TRM 70361]MEE1939782.1 hypothetical protein [Streptomyces sp. TRM 70361]